MSEPEIIYEDTNFLVVNKPSGMLVHAAPTSADLTRTHADKTLVDWLLARYPEIRTVGDDPETRPGIMHRLDRETSGVMVVAKNQEYFEYMKSLFKNRQIKKKYLALLWGNVVPEKGTIQKPIGIKDGTIKRSVHSLKMVKEAITNYRVIKNFQFSIFPPMADPAKRDNFQLEDFSLVEVEPMTGRTHQIRVHMASIGHPILGDGLYGSAASKRSMTGFDPSIEFRAGKLTASRLMLHAASLEFTRSDGSRIKFEAALPEDYQKVLDLLEE